MGKIYKTLICGGRISLTVLETTDIVNTAINYHKLSPVCAAALGRMLTATAFMCSNLKGENEKLSITINGGGWGGQIVTAGDGKMRVRGSIQNPRVDIPLKPDGKLNVGAVVGNNGYITVVKNLGLKEPYVGRCKLVSGEIAEDITAYYAYSEQQPTATALGVLIGTDGNCLGAGGLVVQPLPDATDDDLTYAEKLIGNFADVSKKINELGGEGLCKKYFADCDFTAFDAKYECNCNKEYIDKVLLAMGEKELRAALKEQGKIEVTCEFCDKKYVYDENGVNELLKQ